MADMDLDDLDAPRPAPARPSRFAPKGSKLKPKTESSTVSSSETATVPLTKKEELETKPPFPLNPFDAAAAKAKDEDSIPNSAGVPMDVDAKPEEKEEELPKDETMAFNEDGEDEIVREIDVYFNPSINPNTKLYVFQYPLRPLWRPYELDDRCEEVRVKPKSAEVEVDLAVDVDSKNYDRDVDPRVAMQTQTLTSSSKPPIAIRYAVGVLVGNKLHLNPVDAVVQLRPSLQHLKPEGARRKNSATDNPKEAVKEGQVKEEKPTGSAKKQNKPSSAPDEQKKEKVEDWISLKYLGARSDASARYLRKMVEQDESPLEFTMSRFDYVNTMCPGKLKDDSGSKYPSKRVLLSLPPEDRFRNLFLEGPPIHRFVALKNFAPDLSDEHTLGVLRKLARLVQGLWVPNSSLMYAQGPEQLARDYVLLLFSKSPIIHNSQVPPQTQLAKAVKDILNILARPRRTLGDWKFKESPDISFMKLHPNIVKEEEEAWERREKQITDFIFRGRDRPALKNSSKSSASNPATLKSSSKQTSKPSNEGPPRTPMSDETREALPKVLLKILQNHKVCSFQQICQRLREMAVSQTSLPKGASKEAVAAAKGVDAPVEDLQAVIGQVATNIHGVYVSKSSADHPECDVLRKLVIDLLIAEGPNAKLKKASIVEAAKLKLGKTDIGQAEYQKVLKVLTEICVSTKGSYWVLRSGDGNPR